MKINLLCFLTLILNSNIRLRRHWHMAFAQYEHWQWNFNFRLTSQILARKSVSTKNYWFFSGRCVTKIRYIFAQSNMILNFSILRNHTLGIFRLLPLPSDFAVYMLLLKTLTVASMSQEDNISFSVSAHFFSNYSTTLDS